MSVIAYLAAVFGVFAMDLLGEKMDLPDMMGKEFLSMSHNLWGILALAVVGPITEELVFREGIQGFMQRKGVSCWTAIIISALCFGVIHFNPAQIPFAFGIALILGIIYYKTGNVLLTSLIHITNNSMAVLEMRILGEDIETFSYEQALGGSLLSWVHIAVAAMVSVFLLCHYWKKA
jgi:membrane protease YdiL (CAAX protease family)